MSLRRRSVRIAGHRTSVSIEDPFWEEIRRAAQAEGKSTARLIAEIDAARADDSHDGAPKGSPNLSSALRLYVLERLRSARADRG